MREREGGERGGRGGGGDLEKERGEDKGKEKNGKRK